LETHPPGPPGLQVALLYVIMSTININIAEKWASPTSLCIRHRAVICR
jgi:hypothetical protein